MPSLGGFDIWTATRATDQATWTTPPDVMAINSALEDRVPWISGDNLTIGFGSTRAGGRRRRGDLGVDPHVRLPHVT
jgi:hypothetical protein